MSDPIESNEYLDPAFDSQSLKVVELRRIFFEHDVDFKTTAKKAELVQIFNEEIRPRAKDLLRSKTSPAKSSNKVETVGGASPVVLPTTTPRRGPGRPRKNAANESDEPTTVKKEPSTARKASAPATGRKSVGRPRKHPKPESDEESSTPATNKRHASSRSKSAASADETTATEDEVEDKKPKSEKRSFASTFSSLNPFQSGSPPTSASPAKRRQTAVPNSTQKLSPPKKADRRKTDIPLTPSSLSSAAGTDEVEMNFAHPEKTPKNLNPFKNRESFMPSVSSLKASPAFQSAAQRRKENDLARNQLRGSDADEDEHVVTSQKAGRKTVSTSRAKKQLVRAVDSHPIKEALQWLLLLSVLLTLAYGAERYRQEKLSAGYCGVDSLPVVPPPHASELERAIHWLRPQCTPCPPHGVCSPGFQLRCEDEFVKKEHPLSLSGYLPISGHCEPDTEKLRKIQIVANEIIETLRDRTANAECGYATTPTSSEVGMSRDELKAVLQQKKSSSISTEQFETLFSHAIDDIRTRDEIEISSR
ncbi:hypothetical protein MRB53_042144 [Persea americana]|nr:hypothetical protein MRB53_042144 [Persea americana]